MRIISIDTETTGLLFYEGHRIIEIACIELINEEITNNAFHTYINPNREIEKEAKKITGLNENFLKDKPKFEDIVEKFFDFIKNSEYLIMHNAKFDTNFINNELKIIKHEIKNINKYFNIIDTLELARKIHPGKKNNLDSLCKRYDINISKRYIHSALIDAELLAKLYIKINKQKELLNFKKIYNIPTIIKNSEIKKIMANEKEITAHEKYIKTINKKT